jgi:Fe-S-cluster-containing hydrogenase component 2
MPFIVRRATDCYGCRTCQLVCSFHHTRTFWPERSSIRVTREPSQGTVRWVIDETCDRCVVESEPLCVRYCAYGALQTGVSVAPHE